MSGIVVKHRRGTAAECDAITPAEGELIVDTDNNRLRLGDGSTAGGHIFYPNGTPGGSNTQVQFNSSGAFGGSANLTWVSPALTIGVAGSATGQLKLTGSTSGTVTVQGAAAAGTWSLTLPTSGGTNGYFLQTNGSGVTTWAAAAVSPGGSDTQLQYNSSGSFAGISGATTNGTVVDLAGGTHTAITSLGIRSTGSGAYDLTLANTENLTAGRTLTLKLNDAARTIDIAGNLTLAAAFITSGANSLTLTTSGATNVTLPTSGTLAALGGTNSWSALNTFSGGLTVSSSALTLSGDQSAAAWTTSGIRIKASTGTLTDTSSSGTVAAAYTNVLGGNTIAASSATTFTHYYNLFIGSPAAGTNVTLTNGWALGTSNLRVTNTTASTSSTTGCAVFAGGIGVTAASYFNNTLTATDNMYLTGSAGTARGFRFQTSGSSRFLFYCTATAETGSNAGSNFGIAAYADDGTTLIGADDFFRIDRATGYVTIVQSGLVMGNPTGGNKGVGTINCANDVYKNNSAYTNPDYVLEHAYTGKVVKFAGNPGASEYTGRMNLDDLRTFTRSNLRLPGIGDGPTGAFRRADIALEKIEELTLHVLDLHDRIKQLEAA